MRSRRFCRQTSVFIKPTVENERLSFVQRLTAKRWEGAKPSARRKELAETAKTYPSACRALFWRAFRHFHPDSDTRILRPRRPKELPVKRAVQEIDASGSGHLRPPSILHQQ